MAKGNTSEIGFEKEIWEAANELRGSMDAAEYKHVVLGLIFLKYLSDKFEERYQELIKDDYFFKLSFRANWKERTAKNKPTFYSYVIRHKLE